MDEGWFTSLLWMIPGLFLSQQELRDKITLKFNYWRAASRKSVGVSKREKLTWMELFFSSSCSRWDHGRMCDIKNRPTLVATIFLAHMEGEESGRGEGERRDILIGRRVSACTHTHTHTRKGKSNAIQWCTMRKWNYLSIPVGGRGLQLIDPKSVIFHAEKKEEVRE